MSAPFIHTERTTKYMYFCLLIALIPAVTFAVFYYGIRAIILIFFCTFLSSLCHGFKDYSAPVHGAVLALMLPASSSIVSAAVGVIVSEFLIKKMFGGSGSNIVYPAAFSRVLLELMFPSDMVISSEPGQDWFALRSLITIGGSSKKALLAVDYSFTEVVAGRFPSYMGMGCFVLIIIGMLFIWQSRAARLAAPVTYLITVFAVKMLLNINGSFTDISMFIMTSGVVFAAAYMLTEPSNTAQFGAAALAEGAFCGVATALLSLRVSGITLVLVPILLNGLMDGSIRFYCSIADKKKAEATVR